jgi:hypothetical protein
MKKLDLIELCGGYQRTSEVLECSIGHVYNLPDEITGKRQLSNIMLRLKVANINTLSPDRDRPENSVKT